MTKDKEGPKQLNLFGHTDDREFWEKHWIGMPEYMMQNLEAKKQLKVNFLTDEHYEDFCKLIGQKLTPNTKSIWFPAANKGKSITKAYVDKEAESDNTIHELPNICTEQEAGDDFIYDKEFE